MEYGDVVGMLTFREVILSIVKSGREVGGTLVRKAYIRDWPAEGEAPEC